MATPTTSLFVGNGSRCDMEAGNPWCGRFGGQQVFEVIYLIILAVVGTIGNTILIISVIYEQRAYKYGNIFVINLAFADFIITGVYTPTVIANVFYGGNALPMSICKVFGYVVITSCTCSMWNLALISLNRYWAIVRHQLYNVVFCKPNVHFMLTFIWVYSIILPFPVLTGWTALIYDYKSMVCAWDDVSNISFTIYLLTLAILVPLVVTIFCYYKLFRYVRKHSRRMQCNNRRPTQKEGKRKMKRSIQREISLIKALATAVVCFLLCWTPYCFCILLDRGSVDPLVKKICTWLGLNNSAVNFMIYGLMNYEFRRGYKNVICYMICCKKDTRIINQTKSSKRSSRSSNEVQQISTKV